jgi:excisionase family DNA binding protein
MSTNRTAINKAERGPGRRPRLAPAPQAPDADLGDIDREREVITLREAAEYLNCHPTTLYRMVNHGNIPGFRLGGGWRFRRSDLDKWIASLTVVSPAEAMESKPVSPKRTPKGREGKPKR